MATQIIDISPEITQAIAVFPGDVPFTREIGQSFEQGSNFALSSIKSTLHLGAHTDAPNHYHIAGEDIASRDLDYYIGDCQVIEVRLSFSERIRVEHVSTLEIQAPRILFKTESFTNPNQWHEKFNALSAELIDWLAERGVKLVGIDTPSIDPPNDKSLESHQAVHRNNMAILEGIVLSEVKEGLYTLIALPLKIKDADASPVRAVLLYDI